MTAMKVTKPVAIIPARGGSKRLSRKNIRPFAGRPMLAWTVEAAASTGLFADIFVSTEDDEIAACAREAGATVLKRPAEFATDAAGIIDVLRQIISDGPNWPEIFCLLAANCPLRTGDDIRAGYREFLDCEAPAMLSVTSYGWTPPFRALFETEAGLKFAFPEYAELKGQYYPDAVCSSGAVYWARSQCIATADTLYVPGIRGFRMPWHRAVDIDTEDDMRLAACLFHAVKGGFSFDRPVE
ncbi:MAG: acylneuraminate cytidylyltransferase family protein [Rhizobiaceae bacterium]